MKRRFLFALFVPTWLVTTSAFADEKAACLEAASKGQPLRDAHKLVEAREQFLACAARQCPAIVQIDCANWLEEVKKALPSVVVTAKSEAGVDLADVKVSVDGKPFASQLNGEGIAINPGPHAFHFERADGTSVDRQMIVKEGEKSQSVAVVFGAAATLSPQPAAPPSPGENRSASSGPRWKTVGWVLAGAGVVGLGLGTAFGLSALADKNGAGCNSNNQCEPGKLSDARHSAFASDVGFIAGGVLVAAGAGLVLFASGTPGTNRAHEKSVASVRVAPVVGVGGGGVILGGSW